MSSVSVSNPVVILNLTASKQSLPGGTTVKDSPANAGDVRDIFNPQVRKIPWGKKWQQSSSFAWRIPWTEEPGHLQSKGSQRIRHN